MKPGTIKPTPHSPGRVRKYSSPLYVQYLGGYDQPAAACEVHHVSHKANGGKTSTKECVLLCFYHHQVVIHRWCWTLVLNPDGTTTAWNKDKTKDLAKLGRLRSSETYDAHPGQAEVR